MKRVIKFEKKDCAPCTMVSEFLDRKGVQYEKINPFDHPEMAARFHVRSVPTVIVLEQEEEVGRTIGFKPEELTRLVLADAV